MVKLNQWSLFYVADKKTGGLFLIDTGANVSVVPLPTGRKFIRGLYKLEAVNNSHNDTYDRKKEKKRKTNKQTNKQNYCSEPGNEMHFSWILTIAQVKTSIIGIDFLAYIDLPVNTKK